MIIRPTKNARNAAVVYTSTGLNVYELIRCAARITSLIAQTDNIAVALKIEIIVPIKGGITILRACGNITFNQV